MNAEQEYDARTGERDTFKMRCYQYALWTIPSLFLNTEQSTPTEEHFDYQMIGAQGLVNLASKIMLLLFHPTRPFFKITVSTEERAKLLQSLRAADLDTVFGRIEQLALEELNISQLREKLEEVFKLLIQTGDCVLYTPKTGRPTVYNLHQYVREYDGDGCLNVLIIREAIQRHNLPEELQKILGEVRESDTTTTYLYTVIERVADSKRYTVTQELEGKKVNAIDGNYDVEALPWISLHWSRTGKENYGRGRVEECAAGFEQLSNVCQTMAELTTLLSDIKGLVNPEGTTSAEDLNAAEPGEYVSGKEGDIFWAAPDIKVQLDCLGIQYERLKREIGGSFLLQSALTRDAERVTAEEIRMIANELETVNAGFYSNMSINLQKPLAKFLIAKVDKQVSKLQIRILSGLDALARFNEVQSIKQLVSDLAQMNSIPPDAIAWLKMQEIIKMLAAGYGLEYGKFLKSAEEHQADVEASMQAIQQHQAALEAGKTQQQET